MRAIYGLWLALAALLLGACDAGAADNPSDYRYRLTVEVETPQGLKAGSSVIEVKQRLVRPGSDPISIGVERRARGEAVTVDLPDGRTLFALLRSKDDSDWAAIIMQSLAPDGVGEGYVEQLNNMLLIEGVQELPRMRPPLDEQSAYPMLVTFGDIDDPTSLERVDPDDLAATFGEGVSLKRITVQITDDPVTTGIEERLGWILDPNVMENPGWASLPRETREVLIGVRAGKVGSEK
ncbi:MAG: hypothetical protein AAGL68_06305 [Pseudomonadota bacterium]